MSEAVERLRRGRLREPEWTPSRCRGVHRPQDDRDIAGQLSQAQQVVNFMRKKLMRMGLITPRRKGAPLRASAIRKPLPPSPFVDTLRRGLSYKFPQQRLVKLCARVQPHAELALKLIRQGRPQDRPHVLSDREVLCLMDGMVGRRRLAAIFALGPLMDVPLRPRLQRQLFRGFTRQLLSDLFCRTIKPGLATRRAGPRRSRSR
jgi:hypothetical protein